MRADRLLLCILAIASVAAGPAHAQAPLAPADPTEDATAEAAPAPRGLRTVILDPGHGGDDPGVTASSGLTESEIALDVCRRIHRIFEARLGTQRVVLTRGGDVNLSIASRVSTANGSKGDVLVSIHVAGSAREGAAGPRVYAMSSGLRIVELAERRLRPRARRLLQGQVDVEGGSDLRLTPWALAQADFAGKSSSLAAAIGRELSSSTGKQAPVATLPLAVLAGARMPAVLVELGHLTNPGEADQLKSSGYRDRLAGAVFRGITSFALPGALAAQGSAAAAPPADPE